jgi:hypothetical protein
MLLLDLIFLFLKLPEIGFFLVSLLLSFLQIILECFLSLIKLKIPFSISNYQDDVFPFLLHARCNYCTVHSKRNFKLFQTPYSFDKRLTRVEDFVLSICHIYRNDANFLFFKEVEHYGNTYLEIGMIYLFQFDLWCGTKLISEPYPFHYSAFQRYLPLSNLRFF